MAESAKNKQTAKQQQEQAQKFMASGIDFSPFILDVGDGVNWEFTPDPSPAETQRLSRAMKSMSEVSEDGGDIEGVFDEITKAIRDRIMDEKQKKEFPKPIYGTNALMWFGLRLATGRDGFPTE